MLAKLVKRFAAHEARKRIEVASKLLTLPEYQENDVRNILISVRWQAIRALEKMKESS